jgi:hypothetical protein
MEFGERAAVVRKIRAKPLLLNLLPDAYFTVAW